MATEIEINKTQHVSAPTPKRRAGARKGGLKLQEFMYMCLEHWSWFAVSLAVCLTAAFIYVKKTAPTYQKQAKILIKTDTQGRSISTSAAMFEDLGVNQGNSLLFDEIQVIKSADLMKDVASRLNLDMHYSTSGRFRDIELYGSTQPVQVSLPDLKDEDAASFILALDPNGEYTLTEMTLRGNQTGRGAIKGRIGETLKTPLGRVLVTPGESYTGDDSVEIKVSKAPLKAVANGILGKISVETDEKAWNLVTLTCVDTDPKRAEDILNTIISSYNDKWIKDKRTLADNSSKFIDERVQLLQDELGSVENDISSFKSANLMPDVDAAASIYMSQASQASMALKDLRNQEYMAKYIRNYLRNSENQNKLLPTSTGLANSAISSQIAMYNTKVLERNSLLSQSSATNPMVIELDQVLASLRSVLVASIDNEILALSEQIRSQEGLSSTATSKIASNPKQAKYLLSVERQQKVKESLYLYLLQKREENQLNQAFTSYNTRIVNEADGSNAPIAPNTANIMLIGLITGLALPALLLYQREMAVHVVRGRKDIQDMKIPLAGELPLHSKKQKLQRVNPSNRNPKPVVAVRENSRNSINEAFRVLRTNLEFMLGTDPASKCIMLTSANPGSGKTFVTYNLACSLAIKGKRVALLDLDMRKASLSKYIDDNGRGLSDYLANRINDITTIMHTVPEVPNMTVLPVGTPPPNPTELLFNERLTALILDLKVHYDYVLIDCPPVEVVADATIISKHADYTLFVIRAGILDLSMLPVIDELYEKGTYPNMSLVLNGTINPRNSYARRYGNPYSYGYGYGTGYTYSND